MQKTLFFFFFAFCSLYVSAQLRNSSSEPDPGYLNISNSTELSDSPNVNAIPSDSNRAAPYALIAGGSKGIGFALAEALARRGYNLILIARHWETLLYAQRTLKSRYPVHVEVLSFDLSKEETATQIAAWCKERNIQLKMLCNVAGLGGEADYLSLPLDSLRYMIRLNLESTMALSLTLLPLLEKNAPSYILNVASMAGFAPIPSKNLYAATKAAVVSFSYSLRYQLRSKHISVSCLAPGPVYTNPAIKRQTKKLLGWLGNAMAMKPARVGEVTIRKTLKGRLIIVPGTIPRILSIVLRIAPQRWVTYIYGSSADRINRKSQ